MPLSFPLRQFCPLLGQYLVNRLGRVGHQAPPGDHDDVAGGELAHVVAETLPDDPFDPVTDHCMLGALSRDYQTEPRVLSPIVPRKDGQISV